MNKTDLVNTIINSVCPEHSLSEREQLEAGSILTDPIMEQSLVNGTIRTDKDKDKDPELLRLEMQVCLQQAETEKLRLQLELNKLNISSSDTISHFDLVRASKIMPTFSEDTVDEFFCAFEMLAETLKWPRGAWLILLQRSFTGKALRTYTSLPARDISYETVKEEVLKAYALVPEAYRQRFRGIARKYDETHLEFARNKRDAFTRWLRSKGVNSYETLFELILMEDFLSSVTRDVSLYLLDRDFETVEKAAGQADVYVLRHVKTQCNGVSQVSKTSSSPFQQKKVLKTDDQTTVVKTASPPTGVFVKSEYLCTFCGKSGHKAEFCWRKRKPTLIAFKNAKTKSPQKEKPVALVSPPSERETSLQEDLLDVSAEGSHIGAYSPFLSRGFVLENNDNIPITILRDSGSLQTLIRSGITTGEETGKFVVLGSLWGQGSAPLIKIHLNSDCFCGLATVAVLPELPVRGVDLILGNDLAGGNMGQPFSPPVLSERPQTSTELQQLETQEPHLFPLCAVTRSMAKSRQALESNQAGSSGGESLAEEQVCLDISGLFADQASVSTNCKSPAVKPMVGRAALIAAQQGDETLQPWIEQAYGPPEESSPTTNYFVQDGVLYRRWLPPLFPQEDAPWASVTQLVVPTSHRQVAARNSEQARDKAKTWYDKRARHREFHPGDEVLLLLPIQGQPLHAKFSGPYKVIKKISSTNYIISTPDRRRSQRLCHINTLKQYHSREPPDTPPDSSVPVCAADVCLVDSQHEEEEDVSPITLSSVKTWQSSSATMQEKLEHLQQPQKTEVLDLLYKYPSVFKNEPGRTTAVAHDIDVGSASPIKQAPYRVHPSRVNQMMSELADMESLGVIEPSQELVEL
ncbi:hypothetical protein Pcinc_001925 [Petrolisthes cinctipes]|uniref:SCAN box domain-containing protein n=1 Tax=Petrolisthes cinctipes TaxID=88211 RepID=A0AAE1GLX3_PETCI|nr:hypothetical protein Pcinc_001925 [Petrolisthes cinctipes]